MTPDLISRDALLREALACLDTSAADAMSIRNKAAVLLRELASLVVNAADTPERGRDLLQQYDAPRVLQVFLETSEICHSELLRNLRTGPNPDGGAACNGPISAVVHLAWLIDHRVAAARVVDIALDPVVVTRLPKAKFWDAYFVAMRGVARRMPFEIPDLKLRGLEKYWFSCIQLAAALASGADAAPFVAAAEIAFQNQNRDKRSIDWLSVDGDGNAPVKWNIRVASLRLAIPK